MSSRTYERGFPRWESRQQPEARASQDPLDQGAFPALPIFPAGAVMVMPMASKMQKYEREAVLGVLATAAVEAGAWTAISEVDFEHIAGRAISPLLIHDVLSMVRVMVREGLVELVDGMLAPTPQLVAFLDGCHMDYVFEHGEAS